MLTSLDISHNDIEIFPSFALYPSKHLRVFAARHNAPNLKVSYAGLGPAMRYCGGDGPPIVLLDDPTHCSTVVKEAEERNCFYVNCGPVYKILRECNDGVKKFIPYHYLCDEIDDGCKDEICQPIPIFRSSEGSSEQNPACQDIVDCFPGRASLHIDGDLVYLRAPLVDGMGSSCPIHIDFSTRLFFTRNLTPWKQEIVDGPRRLTMDVTIHIGHSFQSTTVVATVIARTVYHSGFSNKSLPCSIIYVISTAAYVLQGLVSDESVLVTTTQHPTAPSDQSGSDIKQLPIVSIVVAVGVPVVLLVAGVVVLLHTRRRNHVLHPDLSVKVCLSPRLMSEAPPLLSLSR